MQYQSAAYSLPNFPRALALSLFPENLLVTNTTKVLTWHCSSMQEVSSVMSSMLAQSTEMTVNGSMALKTPSERVIRLISTVVDPLEISIVKLKQGYEMMYVNFNFVLIDQDGELTPPLDNKRRPMCLVNEADIRSQALVDVRLMAEKNFPLGPGWWRQLGQEERAVEVEEMLRRPQGGRTASTGRRSASETYEIDQILDERPSTGRAGAWLLVRWAGYNPDWERWRIHGR